MVIWVLNYAENLYDVHVVQICIFPQLPGKICVNGVFWNFKTYSMNFLVLIFSFFTSHLLSERRHTQVGTGKNGNIQFTSISPLTVLKYLKWEGTNWRGCLRKHWFETKVIGSVFPVHLSAYNFLWIKIIPNNDIKPSANALACAYDLSRCVFVCYLQN